MTTEAIKKFADMTRFDNSLIKILWENSYIVVKDLKEIADPNQAESALIIKTYSIPKRSKKGEVRNIYWPNSQQLNTILKITSRFLSSIYSPTNVVHGFVKKKGIKTNAQQHLECNILCKIDLENFFEQIDMADISYALQNLGVEEDIANIISKICTIKGNLIQGFNTSPIISNIISIELDAKLEDYCKQNNITYTRYADDMSFSSKGDKIDLEPIIEIISKCGFKINDGKTRVLKRGFYQSVTGLTVFDNTIPRIPKRIKRNLRLESYYINKFGIKNHAIRSLANRGEYNKNPNAEEDLKNEINRIRERFEGWISFSRGIEPDFSSKLKKLFDERDKTDSP
ncbi:MAG: reverse transcriptase family protein [Saprospiraceae bacterium]